MKLKFKGNVPTKSTAVAAGLDLRSTESVLILPGASAVVGTGTHWEPEAIPEGFGVAMIVQSRSGYAFGSRVEASNAGVIDQDYRGEMKVLLYNNGRAAVAIEPGNRVAQGVVHLIPKFEIVAVDSIDNDTERGEDGFGSTGVE
jgi:dUTP pyrophosphatase